MSTWIQTSTGKAFDPFAPDPAAICIEDIAHALSNVCRFTGHCRSFYSVAQHSVEVATRLPPELQAHALLHDASEAYLLDLPSPLKQRPEFAAYRWAEKQLQAAIYARFGLDPTTPALVKEMDSRMLLFEKARLLGKCEKPWPTSAALSRLAPAPQYPGWRPLPPADAKREFLNVFYLTFHAFAQENNR
jgi:hypothetical protein